MLLRTGLIVGITVEVCGFATDQICASGINLSSVLHRGRARRTTGEELIFRHPWQGQRNALSLGKTMWPQFLQIKRPSATKLMG